MGASLWGSLFFVCGWTLIMDKSVKRLDFFRYRTDSAQKRLDFFRYRTDSAQKRLDFSEKRPDYTKNRINFLQSRLYHTSNGFVPNQNNCITHQFDLEI